MLPPTDDMIKISSVDSAPSCARVLHVLASSSPKAATAKAVTSPHHRETRQVIEEVELEHRPARTECDSPVAITLVAGG